MAGITSLNGLRDDATGMKLAIKVDVDTYRGTRDGVPVLRELFEKFEVPATFLFSFGPDNTGKALRRIFRKGFLKKCLRSNVAGNYGIKTLLYGTLLKAPKISKLCSAQMKEVRAAGFECGIHSWDHFNWQERLPRMRPTEVDMEFMRARAEFEKIFGETAKCCGAPGWQITPDALETEDKAGLLYASDTRGKTPFFPSMGGRSFKTLQIPTTLPTLDELLGIVKTDAVADMYLGDISKMDFSVMTVHAELEGGAYARLFGDFLSRAASEGVEFASLEACARKILSAPHSVPACEIRMEEFPGRSGLLAQQAL